jgi:hypothetical protein
VTIPVSTAFIDSIPGLLLLLLLLLLESRRASAGRIATPLSSLLRR